MACFLVPTAEAIITTIVQKSLEKKEGKPGLQTGSPAKSLDAAALEGKISWSRKLSWLNKLLWGGALLLAFEHVWHGEVVPWFPFLTAMSNPGDASVMFHEMATIGVSMAILVTAVWAVMVLAADAIARRNPKIAAETAR